jgi:uncharacterized protein involved in exopolysaccharide biosynthesis
MGMLQLLAILWARRAVAFGCFAATLALVVGVTLILPKSYRATVILLINPDSRDPYTNDFQNRVGLSDFLGTQVAIIKSDRTALEVIQKLHLAENPRFKREFERVTGGKGKLEDWIIRRLTKVLKVDPVPLESSIALRYFSPDADMAATVANAYADAYLRTNEEIRVQNARDTSARLQEQARSLQNELGVAEKRLHDYQEKTGLVVAEGDLDGEMKRLDSLTALQVETNSAMEGASAQLMAFRDAKAKGLPLDRLGVVADNQLLASLRTSVATLNGELAQIRGRYGPGHPDYTSGLARRYALEAERASELSRIGGVLEAAVEGGKKKMSELDNAINGQKTRVLQLQSHWDEYRSYFNDVKTKRAQLAQIVQRSGEESIESRVSDMSAVVLSPATPPSKPDFPKLVLSIGLAIGFGLIFGLSMAVLVELFDRRIRSAQDFEDAAGAPVIVVLPKRA